MVGKKKVAYKSYKSINMWNIIGKRKYFYVVSAMLVIGSIALVSAWGLKLGIDFRGGTLMEVQFENNLPESQAVHDKLKDLSLNSLTVQTTGNNTVILRYAESNEAINEQVFERFKAFEGNPKQLRVDFVGASVSNEIKKNTAVALVLAIVGIAVYIAWSFKKVSRPIPSWQYGVMANVALFHDIVITVGAFAFLGKFYGIEVGVPFVAALLTILGYSINDTIVVYDRTRENLMRSSEKEDFEQIVNRSLNETIARSFNTSLTVLIVLTALVIFGSESLRWFAAALLIGIGFGTYSSIFVASALLVTSYKYKKS